MNDTLQTATDSLSLATQAGDSLNWWMIIAIIEFVIIILIILSKRKSEDKRRIIKKQVKNEGEIDWENTIKSSFGAERLYKELIRKCHPDRVAPDEEKIAIANDITERLGKYKHDLNKLNEIKEEAKTKLNI
jgi:hypothetical protein